MMSKEDAEDEMYEIMRKVYRSSRDADGYNLTYPIANSDDIRIMKGSYLDAMATLKMKKPHLLEYGINTKELFREVINDVDQEIILFYKKKAPQTLRNVRFYDAIEKGYATRKELAYHKKQEERWTNYWKDKKGQNPKPKYDIPEWLDWTNLKE